MRHPHACRALAILAALTLAACDDEPATSAPEAPADAEAPPVMSDTSVPDLFVEPDAAPAPDATPAPDAEYDPPVVVVAVETSLGASITAAGVENRVTCIALGPDDGSVPDIQTRIEIRPEEGWTQVDGETAVFVGETAGAYEVTCTAPDLGLRDASPSRWEVQPGAPTAIRAVVEPSQIDAGGAADVRCEAVDAWGNPLDASGATVTVSPENPGIAVFERVIEATGAGRYDVSCALEGASSDVGAQLVVRAGLPAALVAQVVPDEPVYSIGAVVAFSATVTDIFGNVLDGAPVAWTAAPDLPLFGAGRFLAAAEGRYTLGVRVDGPTHMDVVLEDSAEILVDAGGPAIACEGVSGQMVRRNGPVVVEGQVADIAGLAAFEVDGQPVELDGAGRFAVEVQPDWGLNVLTVVARDAFGNENSSFCAFFAADDYIAEDASLFDAIALHLSQQAVDDGAPNNPITSLSDLLRRVIDSPELVQTVDGALRAQNPIVPNDCRLRIPIIGCTVRFGAEYQGIQLAGPNDLTTTLVAGGIRFRATLRNIRLDVRTTGTVRVSGDVRVSEVTVDLTFNVDLNNGRPRVRLRGVNDVRVGNIDLNIDGLGGIFDGAVDLVFGAFEGLVRDELVSAMRGFLESEIDALLSGVLDGIDLASLSQAFEVPTLDGSPPVNLSLAVALDQVNVNAERLRIGISTRVNGDTRQATPSAGIPMVGLPGRVQINAQGTVAAALSLGVVNQVLHRLWRASFFSFADAGALLGGGLPEGTRIGLDVRLPPAAEGIGDNRVRLHLGPAVAEVVYPGLFDEPLRIRLAATVTAGVELIDDQLIFGGDEGVQIENLDLVIDQLALAAGARESIERDLTRIVQAVADQALNDLLPAVPIPDFALPDSLAEYGVPRGTRLGLRGASLDGQRTHFFLHGNFGQ